jgi:hypothetical protein
MSTKIELPEIKHKRGDIVFLITDELQSERMVLGYLIREHVEYELVLGAIVTYHTDIEIATAKNWNK